MSDAIVAPAPPIAGYRDLSGRQVEAVNSNKREEGRILTRLDDYFADGRHDHYALAQARGKFLEAYMWLNRAIMNPAPVRGE